MKFSGLSLGLTVLSSIASAVPTPTQDEVVARAEIAKRASITDVGTGYASQNGGTTGGKGYVFIRTLSFIFY